MAIKSVSIRIEEEMLNKLSYIAAPTVKTILPKKTFIATLAAKAGFNITIANSQTLKAMPPIVAINLFNSFIINPHSLKDKSMR